MPLVHFLSSVFGLNDHVICFASKSNSITYFRRTVINVEIYSRHDLETVKLGTRGSPSFLNRPPRIKEKAKIAQFSAINIYIAGMCFWGLFR